DLCSQRVGNVVTVEVQRGNDVVFSRTQQNLLQESVSDGILDGDFATGLGILELAPWAAVDELGAELFTSQFVTPVTETAFGELHDIALVNQGHGGAIIVDGVLDGLANQTLGAFNGHGLYAQAGCLGETNLVYAEFLLQEVDQFAGIFTARFKLNTGV